MLMSKAIGIGAVSVLMLGASAVVAGEGRVKEFYEDDLLLFDRFGNVAKRVELSDAIERQVMGMQLNDTSDGTWTILWEGQTYYLDTSNVQIVSHRGEVCTETSKRLMIAGSSGSGGSCN